MTLSHIQRVTRLYRQARRTTLDWFIHRNLFETEALKLRAKFDANSHLAGRQAEKVLQDAETELAKKKHPDPYKYIYMPGGSKFMRNHPPPAEILTRDCDTSFV